MSIQQPHYEEDHQVMPLGENKELTFGANIDQPLIELPLDPKCPAEISGETPENQIKKKEEQKEKGG